VTANRVEWNHEAAEFALNIARAGSLELMDCYFDAPMPAISGALRSLFTSAPGHDLICSDYSSIEAVVLAEIAGEEWRREVFRTHGRIYEVSAARITGIPFDPTSKERHPKRKLGKVAELACFSAETEVLTSRGYVGIVDVLLTDKLWDGVEWISHRGVIPKGKREVINLDGVEMTPSHPVSLNGSWMEARLLVSSPNLLSQALAHGSASLPYWAKPRKSGNGTLWCNVAADENRTSLPFPIYSKVSQRGATSAPKKRRLRESNSTGLTKIFARIKSTVDACLTEFRRLLGGATTPELGSSPITAEGEYTYLRNGERIRGDFSSTCLRSTGGTLPVLNLTGLTSTAGTPPEICGLLPSQRMRRISGVSESCKPECSNLRSVYDILNSGPRNRFTIRTNSGHLLVHNSGYGGWIGSWKAFGADEFMSDEEIKQAVIAWRNASPSVVALWGGQRDGFNGIEGAAIQAVLAPGREYEYRGISFVVERGVLMMRLLSGRRIAYHAPELKPSTRRYGELSLSFSGWNTNPKNGAKGWVRMDTYGPRLVENIVQATARDIQRHGIVNLERAGYPIVLHVYDENVAEVKEGVGSVEEFESIMSTMPPWCVDWPVFARGGWRGKRYRK